MMHLENRVIVNPEKFGLGDFRASFRELRSSLVGAYHLNDGDENYSATVSSSKARSEDKDGMGGLNSLDYYFPKVESDRKLRHSIVKKYASDHKERSEGFSLAGVPFDASLDHTMGRILNGAAKIDVLLDSVNGITPTYAKAIDQAREMSRMLEKAAETLFLHPEMRNLSLEDVMNYSDGVNWKKLIASGLAAPLLVGCAMGVPNAEANPTGLPPVVLEANKPGLETPVPGMAWYESEVPGNLVEMSSADTEKLRDKFDKSPVVGYQQHLSNGQLQFESITLPPEYKAAMQLRGGIKLNEAGGGEWNVLIYELQDGKDTQEFFAFETEVGFIIPVKSTDAKNGLVQYSMFLDMDGNYPVSEDKANSVRPLITFKVDSSGNIEKGWMWSTGDDKLHEIVDITSHFKNASPNLNNLSFQLEEKLESQFGNAVYTWPQGEAQTLTFDNGMVFEWNGSEYVQKGDEESTSNLVDVGGGLSVVLGEKVDGGTLIDKFVADPTLTSEQQTEKLANTDYKRVGYDNGDLLWIQNEQGRTILVDATDHKSIIAEFKRTKNAGGTTEVVWNWDKMIDPETGESILFNVEGIKTFDLNGSGLPVDNDSLLKLQRSIMDNEVEDFAKLHEAINYASTGGMIFSLDETKAIGDVFATLETEGFAKDVSDGTLFFSVNDVVKKIHVTDFRFTGLITR